MLVSDWFGFEAQSNIVERNCAQISDKVGCSTRRFGFGFVKTCVCEGDGCNGSSVVRLDALLWSCVGLVTLFHVRLRTSNEF